MSKFSITTAAILGGYVGNHLFNKSASTYVSYLKYSALSLLALLPFLIVWHVFLYPLYFSPLLALPQAPQSKSWKRMFTQPTGNDQLGFTDSLPDTGIYRNLDLLNREHVAITNTKGMAEFFHTRAYELEKDPMIAQFLKTFLGDGLVTAEGNVHKYQRKGLSPAFQFRHVKELAPVMWSKTCELVSLIKEDITTKRSKSATEASAVIEIGDWAARVSLDIISLAGFGSDFSSLSNPDAPLNEAYRLAFAPSNTNRFLFVASQIVPNAIIQRLPFEKTRRIRDGVAMVKTHIRHMIDERQRQMHAHVDDPSYFAKSNNKDIISVAMNIGGFSTDDLLNQSLTFLGAGHETSATAITWGVWVLSQPRHAHIQKRLREEIWARLPSPASGTPVTAEMLEALPYLDAVSKEILRVYGPIPTIGRLVIRDSVEILGVKIPKGTPVRVHPWAINRQRSLWGDRGREFDPERWLADGAKATGGADAMAFATFGHGPHGCIGKNFAIQENKAIMAALVGSFQLDLVGGDDGKIDISYGITARILGNIDVKMAILDGW